MKIALMAAPVALGLAACGSPSPAQTAENAAYCGASFAAGPSRYGIDRPRFASSPACDPWNQSDRIARENWGNNGQGALSEHNGF